jgi:hypothetical protein
MSAITCFPHLDDVLRRSRANTVRLRWILLGGGAALVASLLLLG